MRIILLVALIAMIYTVINGGIITSADTVRVWNSISVLNLMV
jgi:hypothetical protein